MTPLSRPVLAAINHVLDQASWARRRLAAFAGHHVQLRAEPLAFAFGIDREGRLAEPAADALPEVELSFPLAEFPLTLSEGSSRLMNAVRIEGNAELADAVGFVFRNLRWDAEEDLARLVGDIAAHRIVLGTEALVAAQRRAARGMAANLAEYFSEEEPLLVPTPALLTLTDELRELRDGLARLDKRTSRLERRERIGEAGVKDRR